jgi:hypothetical protein
MSSDKRMVAVGILNILQTETGRPDEKTGKIKTMTSQEISEKLLEKFAIEVSPRTVRENVEKMEELWNDSPKKPYGRVRYKRDRRKNSNDGFITDIYIEKKDIFSKGELLLLIDHVKFDKNLDAEASEKLVKKLSNISGNKNASNVGEFSESMAFDSDNNIFADNLNALSEALNFKNEEKTGYSRGERKQVSFYECQYASDKKLHLVSNEKITFNPYHIVTSHGRYYVIGTILGERKLRHYRIDKMAEIAILDTKAESELDKDVREYLLQHPYMQEGEINYIKLRTSEIGIGSIIDEFGTRVNLIPSNRSPYDTDWEASFSANSEDVFRFALHHADTVEVIEPQVIRYRLQKVARDMKRHYIQNDKDKEFYSCDTVISQNRLLIGKNINVMLGDFVKYRAMTEIEKVNTVEIIQIYGDYIGDDWNSLSAYTNTKRVCIRGGETLDLTFAEKLPCLEQLELIKTGVTNLSVLETCKTISRLLLHNNPRVDISAIYQAKNLRILRVDPETANFIDVEKLKHCIPEIDFRIDT